MKLLCSVHAPRQDAYAWQDLSIVQEGSGQPSSLPNARGNLLHNFKRPSVWDEEAVTIGQKSEDDLREELCSACKTIAMLQAKNTELERLGLQQDFILDALHPDYEVPEIMSS